jgi:hypothetical protein
MEGAGIDAAVETETDAAVETGIDVVVIVVSFLAD